MSEYLRYIRYYYYYSYHYQMRASETLLVVLSSMKHAEAMYSVIIIILNMTANNEEYIISWNELCLPS